MTVIIVAAAALIGFTGFVGLLALAQKLADKRADRRGVPIEGPARRRRTSRAYLLAILSGGVTAETVKSHDVRKVLRRRYGKRGAR